MPEELNSTTGLLEESPKLNLQQLKVNLGLVRPVNTQAPGNTPSAIHGMGDISPYANQIFSKNPFPSYKNFESLQYGLGENQSTLDQFANGLATAVATIPSKVVQGFGHVGGFTSWMSTGFDPEEFSRVYDNAIVEAASKYEEAVGEALPVYATRQYAEGNFINKLGTAKFWASDGFDALSFLASAYIPGGIITKVFGLVGKVVVAVTGIKALEKGFKVMGFGAGTGYNAVSESGFEGKEAFDSIFNKVVGREIQKYVDMGYSPEEAEQLGTQQAKEIAGEGAANVFKANMQVLLPSAAWEMKAFFGNPLLEIDDIGRKLWRGEIDNIPTFGKLAAKGFAEGVVVEGLWEEGLQSAIQSFETKKAQGVEIGSSGLITDYFGEWFKGLATSDQWSSMFLGALIGGGAGIAGAKGESKRLTEAHDFASKQVARYKDIIKASNNLLPDMMEQLYEVQADGSLKLNTVKAQNAAKQLAYDYDYVKERISALEKNDNVAVEFLDKHYMARRMYSYLNNPYFRNTDEAYEQFLADLNDQAETFKANKESQFSNITAEALENSKSYLKGIKEEFQKTVGNNKDLLTTGTEDRFQRQEKEIAKKVLFHEAVKRSFLNSYISKLTPATDPGIAPEQLTEEYKEAKKEFDNFTSLTEGLDALVKDSQMLSDIMSSKKRRGNLIKDYIDQNEEYVKIEKQIADLAAKKVQTQEDAKETEKLNFELTRNLRINGYHYFDRIAHNPKKVENQSSIYDSPNAMLGIKDSYYQALGENKIRKDSSLQQIESLLDSLNELQSILDQGSINDMPLTTPGIMEHLVETYQQIVQQLNKQVAQYFDVNNGYSFFNQEEYDKIYNLIKEQIDIINDTIVNSFVSNEEFIGEDPTSGEPIYTEETEEAKLARIESAVNIIASGEMPEIPLEVGDVDENGELYSREATNEDITAAAFLLRERKDLNNILTKLQDEIKPKIDSNILFKDYEKRSSDPKFFEDVFLKEFWIKDFDTIFDQILTAAKYGEANEVLLNYLTAYESILRSIPRKVGVAKDFYSERPNFKSIENELDNILKIYLEQIKPLLETTKEQRTILQKQSEINNRINLWKALGIDLIYEKGALIINPNTADNPQIKALIEYVGQGTFRDLIDQAANNFDNVKLLEEDKGINFNIGYLFKMLDIISTNAKSVDEKMTKDELIKNLQKISEENFSNFSKLYDNTSPYLEAYKKMPESVFHILVATEAKYRLTTTIADPTWSSSVIGQFLKHKSIEKLKEHLKNVESETDNAGGGLSIDRLKEILYAHEQYNNISSLISYLTSSNKPITEFIDKLLPIINTEAITPNFQQLVSLKELYDFMGSDSNFSYLMGVAGTGKSKIISSYITKLTGVKNTDILATSYSTSTANNIKESVNPNQNTITIQDILNDPTLLKDKLILIVDEFDALTTNEEALAITKLITLENSQRVANKQIPIKTIFLGDFTQIKREDTLRSNLDVWLGVFGQQETIVSISPLSIQYRSDVGSINSAALAFQDRVDEITSLETKVSGNISDPNALGVQTVVYSPNDKVLPQIIERLTAAKENGRQKTVIIGSEQQRQDYETLKQSSGLDFNIITYGEAHGQTLDEVYIDIRLDNLTRMNKIPPFLQLNTALYTAISRAQSYVLLGVPTPNFKTIVDPKVANVSESNKKEKELLKKNVISLLDDIKQAYNLNDIETKEEAKAPEQPAPAVEIVEEVPVTEEEEKDEEDIEPEIIDIQPTIEESKIVTPAYEEVNPKEVKKSKPLKDKQEYTVNSPSASIIPFLNTGDQIYFLPSMENGNKIISMYVLVEKDGVQSYELLTKMYVDNLNSTEALSTISQRVKGIAETLDNDNYIQFGIPNSMDTNRFNSYNKYQLDQLKFKVGNFNKMRFIYSVDELKVDPENMLEDMKTKLMALVTNGSGEVYGDIQFKGVVVVDPKYYNENLQQKDIKKNIIGAAIAKFTVEVNIGSNGLKTTHEFYVRLNGRKGKKDDLTIAPIITFYNNAAEIEKILTQLDPNFKLNTREFNQIVSSFKSDFYVKDKEVLLKETTKPNAERLADLLPDIPNLTEDILSKVQKFAHEIIPLVYTSTGKGKSTHYSINNYLSFITDQIQAGVISEEDAKPFLNTIAQIEKNSREEGIFELASPTFNEWSNVQPGVTPHILRILLKKKRVNEAALIKELKHRGVDLNTIPFRIMGKGGLIDTFRETISKNSFIKLKDGSGYFAYDPRAGKIIKVKEKNDKYWVSRSYYQNLKGEEELTADEYSDVTYNTLTGKNSKLHNIMLSYAWVNKTLNGKDLVLGRERLKRKVGDTEIDTNLLIIPHIFQYGLEYGDYKDNKFYGILRHSFDTWIDQQIEELQQEQGLTREQAAIEILNKYQDELTVKSEDEYYDGILLMSQPIQKLREERYSDYVAKLKRTKFGLDLAVDEIGNTLIDFMIKYQVPFLNEEQSEPTSQEVINAYSQEHAAANELKRQTLSLEDLGSVFDPKNINKNGTFKKNSPFIPFSRNYIKSKSDELLNATDAQDKKQIERDLFGHFQYNFQEAQPTRITVYEDGNFTEPEVKEEAPISREVVPDPVVDEFEDFKRGDYFTFQSDEYQVESVDRNQKTGDPISIVARNQNTGDLTTISKEDYDAELAALEQPVEETYTDNVVDNMSKGLGSDFKDEDAELGDFDDPC